MSNFKNYINKKLLKNHSSTEQEINDLFNVARRDFGEVKACEKMMGLDWKFGILYNAILKYCTIVLRASGYRTSSVAHHKTTFECLPLILGEEKNKIAKYLDRCRVKRNKVEYEMVGLVTDEEVEELYNFIISFEKEVEDWMYINYPELMGRHKE